MEQLSMRLRDDGIARAVEHADRVESRWSDKAYAVFCSYANAEAKPFTTEDVRGFARACALPDPPDKRAWGAVARRALKAGLIVPAGYVRAKDPKVHCSVNPAWKRA